LADAARERLEKKVPGDYWTVERKMEFVEQ
jgi:hypothetical protein